MAAFAMTKSIFLLFGVIISSLFETNAQFSINTNSVRMPNVPKVNIPCNIIPQNVVNQVNSRANPAGVNLNLNSNCPPPPPGEAPPPPEEPPPPPEEPPPPPGEPPPPPEEPPPPPEEPPPPPGEPPPPPEEPPPPPEEPPPPGEEPTEPPPSPEDAAIPPPEPEPEPDPEATTPAEEETPPPEESADAGPPPDTEPPPPPESPAEEEPMQEPEKVDYYWRDFKGEIPKDAVQVGTDDQGNPTYGAQAFVLKHGNFFGEMKEGDTVLTLQCFGVKKVTQGIKILCSPHLDKFIWEPVDRKSYFTKTKGKNRIIAGFNHRKTRTMFIGRAEYEGVVHGGSISSYGSTDNHLLFVHKGGQKDVTVFDVMLYDV